MSKVMGIYVKFYHDHSPNMVMSRDPGYKFQNVCFSPNSILKFRAVTKFGGNWLKNKKVTGRETKLGVKNTPTLVIGGLNALLVPTLIQFM